MKTLLAGLTAFGLVLPAPAQAAPFDLPADGPAAARVCAIAFGQTLTRSGTADDLRAASDSLWFTVERASSLPATRVLAMLPGLVERPARAEAAAIAENASYLMVRCGERWPASRRDVPASLPADPFVRSAVCLGLSGLIKGLGEGLGVRGDPLGAARVHARELARASEAEAAQHGYVGTDALTGLMGDGVRRAHLHGNLANVLAACDAQPA